jgi:hypothetical protein
MVDEIGGLHENASPSMHTYFTMKGPGKRNDVLNSTSTLPPTGLTGLGRSQAPGLEN